MQVFEKIIEKLEAECFLTTNDDGETNELSIKVVDLKDAIEIVKQAAAEYNNGWIPCDERTPSMEECQKNDCRFIVTDGNRRYQIHFDYKSKKFVEPMWHNTFNSYIDNKVIAWQPLPEPYQQKGE